MFLMSDAFRALDGDHLKRVRGGRARTVFLGRRRRVDRARQKQSPQADVPLGERCHGLGRAIEAHFRVSSAGPPDDRCSSETILLEGR